MADISSYYTIPIIKVKYPPHQTLNNDPQSHDFAMLILKEAAKFSVNIHPICLPKQDEEFTGESAIAAGWGRTAAPQDSVFSHELKSVRLIVSEKTYRHYKMFGTELHKKNGVYQDPCSGDSGKKKGLY